MNSWWSFCEKLYIDFFLYIICFTFRTTPFLTTVITPSQPYVLWCPRWPPSWPELEPENSPPSKPNIPHQNSWRFQPFLNCRVPWWKNWRNLSSSDHVTGSWVQNEARDMKWNTEQGSCDRGLITGTGGSDTLSQLLGGINFSQLCVDHVTVSRDYHFLPAQPITNCAKSYKAVTWPRGPIQWILTV